MRHLLVIISLICSGSLLGQADIASWTTLQLDYKASDRLNVKLRPILRHKDDLSAYDNTSIDFSLHYKLNKQWSFMLLERHFFIENGPDREFLFFDLNGKANLGSRFTINNKFRYHLALNLTRLDPNFLRYQPIVSINTSKAIKPFFGIDFFYRIETVQELAGARYTLGFNYKWNDRAGLNFQYWRQAGYGEFPIFNSHIFVLTVSYQIRERIKGDI